MNALRKLLLIVLLFGAILVIAGSALGGIEVFVIAVLLLGAFYGVPRLVRRLRPRQH